MAVLSSLLLLPLAVSRPGTGAPAAPPSHSFVVDKARTYEVAQEIGPGSINKTARRWDVYGADLGSMFTYGKRVYVVFGDTFGGPAAGSFFSVNHANWRSSSMAWVGAGAQPRHGLLFGGMVTSGPGVAGQLLASQKVPGVEQTVIPTYGVAVGRTMYLYYMSVRAFGAPGHWSCNYSGVAYSTEAGRVWHKDPKITWSGKSNFGQVALVKKGGYVYAFGIPCGRYGSLELARVPRHRILQKSAYQYWDGHGWAGHTVREAVPIVHGPVGELSVQWNSFYRRWIMMYLVDPTGQIVLRTARSLAGPWSGAHVVVTSAKYPELYAPYLTPKWDASRNIWFDMSLYGPYHVVLMHTQLEERPVSQPDR